MKVKWSGIGMVDGRGKINGSVASKNRSGAYVRTKVTPVNPQSPRQLAVRSTFATISAMWRGLGQVNRDSWNSAVEDWQRTDVFGDLKKPSGFNLFMRLCTPLHNAFNDVIIASYAPTPVEMPAVTEVFANYTISPYALNLVPTIVTNARIDLDEYVFNVYATPALSNGKSFVKNDFRLIGYVEANATSTNVLDMYEAVFGSFNRLANVHIRIQALARATGQLGVPIDAQITQPAP